MNEFIIRLNSSFTKSAIVHPSINNLSIRIKTYTVKITWLSAPIIDLFSRIEKSSN